MTGTPSLDISAVTLKWEGKTYQLTRDSVMKAFDRASEGEFIGPGARFFIEIDGDIKSVEAVLRQIVPGINGSLNGRTPELFASALKTLGLEVLDKRESHRR
jgi:hypothetical protein